MKPRQVFLTLFLGALSSISFSTLLAQGSKGDYSSQNISLCVCSNVEENSNDETEQTNFERAWLEDGVKNFTLEEHQITVEEYCDLLNALAADDPHHFYDERMESNPDTACIIRFGNTGNYTYWVVEGKGDIPIASLSWFNKAQDCNWREKGKTIVRSLISSIRN